MYPLNTLDLSLNHLQNSREEIRNICGTFRWRYPQIQRTPPQSGGASTELPLNRKFQIGLESVPVTKLMKGPLFRKPTNFKSLKTVH